jgi:hypothetical protein
VVELLVVLVTLVLLVRDMTEVLVEVVQII